MKDYYKILNVSNTASQADIKKAFRTLAKKYHPDKNKGDDEALRNFQEINEAYDVLGKEESRKKYDDKLNAQSQRQETSGMNSAKSSANGGSKKEQRKAGQADFENLNSYFESFFGFNANSNVVDKDKLNKNKSKNPLDVSDMFDAFFKVKKK